MKVQSINIGKAFYRGTICTMGNSEKILRWRVLPIRMYVSATGIGSAIFEVTQPRVTCYKVGISLGVPEMPALLVAHNSPEPLDPAGEGNVLICCSRPVSGVVLDL